MRCSKTWLHSSVQCFQWESTQKYVMAHQLPFSKLCPIVVHIDMFHSKASSSRCLTHCVNGIMDLLLLRDFASHKHRIFGWVQYYHSIVVGLDFRALHFVMLVFVCTISLMAQRFFGYCLHVCNLVLRLSNVLEYQASAMNVRIILHIQPCYLSTTKF